MTLTSLFVGLIAIFQAFFSTDNLNRTIGILDKSSSEISENSTNLNKIVIQLKESFDIQFANNAAILTDLGKKLDDHLAILPQNSKLKKSTKDNPLNKTFVQGFVSRSSVSAQLYLYAAKLAYTTKRSFRLEDIISIYDNNGVSYMYGYFIASSAAQIISHVKDGDDWRIVDFNADLFIIDEVVAEIINNSVKQDWYTNFIETKSKIDQFFT